MSTGAWPLFMGPGLYFHSENISLAMSVLSKNVSPVLHESKKALGSKYYSYQFRITELNYYLLYLS